MARYWGAQGYFNASIPMKVKVPKAKNKVLEEE